MKLKELREKNKKINPKHIAEFTREFYQTKQWRQVREQVRKSRRAKHEKIIMQVYEENLDKNSPDDLMKFFNDERKNPLDETELEKGIIKVADVCDHIHPIRLGGSKTDHDNLQWLTTKNHYIKTKEEQNSEYED